MEQIGGRSECHGVGGGMERQLKVVEVLCLRWQMTVQDDDAGKRKVEKEGSEQMKARNERHSIAP